MPRSNQTRAQGRKPQPYAEHIAIPPHPGNTTGTQAAAATRRLAAKETELAEREPLRRRILAVLAEQPANPRTLARKVGAAPESVSRQLTTLRNANLVHYTADFADRRQREYALTADGEIQLAQHRAFGSPEPPAVNPTQAQVHDFLGDSLQKAVMLRRKTNRLAETSERLKLILNQAEEANAHDLAMDTMAELATTLRQERRFAEVDELLETLELFSVGQHPSAAADMVLPAAAHYAYALGRLRDEHRETAAERGEHLATAVQLYAHLAEQAKDTQHQRWRERQAWGLVSLANNLRARSRYDDALDYTQRALSLFDDLEDPYGRSHCKFLSGFCLRLLGDFDGASTYLEDACELAAANAFERFQADSLMQLGEVRRCQGNVEDAGQMLDEALERARNMGLTVVLAFALSARGAVYYQTHDPEHAIESMRSAHTLFEQCDHAEGLALNARRQAIVVRTKNSARRSLETASRLINFALGSYRKLNSPAGMAACETELSRLQLQRRGEAKQTITSLIRRLDDPQQQPLLVRDPWVPRVLDSFATTLDSGDSAALKQRTTTLLAAADRWIEGLARRRADRETSASAQPTARSNEPDRFGIDEMGGETRRYQEPVAIAEYSVC
jgi:tetratricopeptide (TPR) repeat protein